jgi:hypothetical protein
MSKPLRQVILVDQITDKRCVHPVLYTTGEAGFYLDKRLYRSKRYKEEFWDHEVPVKVGDLVVLEKTSAPTMWSSGTFIWKIVENEDESRNNN